MLCLLSPTKSIAVEACAAMERISKAPLNHAKSISTTLKASSNMEKLSFGSHKDAVSVSLAKPRAALVERCKRLKKNEIKSLMRVSEAIASFNFERFQAFGSQRNGQAAFMFDGPSFKKLNVRDFSEAELQRLDSRLCVLSGMYGILAPSERIEPYRLEMGTRLDIEGQKDLYSFWAKYELTKLLSQRAKELGVSIILNCASQEYARVLDFNELEKAGLDVVTINFVAASGRMASVYAKQARGMMARFVAKKNPSCISELHTFTGDGHYSFSETRSTNLNLVFERHSKIQHDCDEEGSQKACGSTRTKEEEQSISETKDQNIKRKDDNAYKAGDTKRRRTIAACK